MIMALGDAYLEKGLFAEAAKRYHQLIEFKVGNRHLYTNLSKAYIGLKRTDKLALEIYQKAIQYDQGNKDVYNILAAAFIKDEREDAPAIEIYEMALRHDTPLFDKLADQLSTFYYKKKEWEKTKEITEKQLNKTGFQEKPFALFLQSCWLMSRHNDAINQLKKLIDTTENNIMLLKSICLTYLEKKFFAEAQNQAARFSFIDRQLVADYLKRTSHFENLQELCLYLELKRFLLEREYWGLAEPIALEEETIYEYEEMESAAAAKPGRSVAAFNIGQEVLNKLSPFEPLLARGAGAHSTLTYEDFKKEGTAIFTNPAAESEALNIPGDAEIVTTIEMANFEYVRQNFGLEQVQQNRSRLFTMLTEILERYKIFQIWVTSNGMLLFSNDILSAVALAVEIQNKLNRQNFTSEPKEEIHLSIGVHHARQGLGENNDQSLRDLSTGVKIGVMGDQDLTAADRVIYGKIFQKTDRIFLSSKAYREVKSANRFKVNVIGQFKIKYLKENLNVHEVAWRNPIDDLRFGFIKRLGRFDLLAEIGSKGAIKVFKAKDSTLQRFTILKVIQSEAFNSLPPNNQQKMEFYNLAKALGQMNHPNITTIYEVDEDQGLTYIAREFVEGVPLTEVLRNSKGFSMERLIKIIYQVCKGLQYSHRSGFFHLNLKPNNIRVGNNDEIKIMDFLIPRQLFYDYDNFKQDAETMYYLSPEQMRGSPGDGRSDIFALGVIFYQLVTQVHPFASKNVNDLTHAILNKRPAPPSELNKGVTKFSEAFIMKCLEKNPDKRFASVEQMVTLLKKTFETSLFSSFNYQIAQSRDSY